MPSANRSEARAAPRPLDALLAPRAIAVVGATPDLGKPGGRYVRFLRKYGFSGAIYPVNPRYEIHDGVRYYPDLRSIPGSVDLVALLVPAGAVPGYLREAGAIGARAAMICASGFAEAGPAGQALQDQVVDAARDGALAVLGPNCVGMANLEHGLVASFSNVFEGDLALSPGPIAFVSQSGAMGSALFSLAQSEGIGVGTFLSTGNEAVLDFADFLEHLAEDANTSVILGYVEALRDGRRFVEAARRARAGGRHVAVVKVGRSDAGKRAAHSHTGALVGSVEAYDAAFRRAGVLEAADVRGLLDLAAALPGRYAFRGSRVGIVSSSGGAAVMMTDACLAGGLDVPPFAETTRAALAAVLPSYVGANNPVDYGPVYADPDAIEACLQAVAEDPTIDAVLYFLAMSPGMAGIIEPRLARVQERARKPVIAVWMAGPPAAIPTLRSLGVAAYDDVTRAVRVGVQLAKAARPPIVVEPRGADPARAALTRSRLEAAITEGRRFLSERETKALLAPYGLPVVADLVVRTPNEAEAAVRGLGVTAVVKADAPDLLHKSDAGAVRLGVTAETAREAYEAVVAGASRALGETVETALVQPQAAPGLEVLVGMRLDPSFGPMVTVGLGGVTTEILADVATELVPTDRTVALTMIERLAGARLLGAYRGAPVRDREALADVIAALGDFAVESNGLVEELDLNPVIVHAAGEGCVLVDAAAVLRAEPAR